MRDQVYQFVIDSLRDMNYPVDGVEENTTLGPAGVDLESLAIAELGVRVEDRYGVRFVDEEADDMANLTIGEFADTVAARYEMAQTAGQALMSGPGRVDRQAVFEMLGSYRRQPDEEMVETV